MRILKTHPPTACWVYPVVVSTFRSLVPRRSTYTDLLSSSPAPYLMRGLDACCLAQLYGRQGSSRQGYIAESVCCSCVHGGGAQKTNRCSAEHPPTRLCIYDWTEDSDWTFRRLAAPSACHAAGENPGNLPQQVAFKRGSGNTE